MSQPVVTPTSDNHSANVSKTQDPHSVAHESVPPESRPVGNEEHGTTGPDDAPPGAPEGESYPPQKHAGQVGLGPHYAEVHGNEAGIGAKITGLKEQIKGKITRNPELAQRGHDRATGELKAKQQAEDDAKSPFKTGAEGGDKPTEGTPTTNPAEKVASHEGTTERTSDEPKAQHQAEGDAKSPFKGAEEGDKSTAGTPALSSVPTTNPAEKVASHEATTEGTPAATHAGPMTEKVTPH